MLTSLMSEPRYKAVSGVCSAGFKMMVHPAATAGAILAIANSSGAFHCSNNASTLFHHCSINNTEQQVVVV